MAVGAYGLVENIEQQFGEKYTLPKDSPKVKRTAAGLLILLGLILAVVSPDRTIAKPAVSEVKPQKQVESVQEPAETSELPDSTGFKIVDDEGC